MLRGQSWTAFQTLLALRGDRARPRMAYLDGEVELMGTSRGHEGVKGKIGSIAQQYCFEREVPLTSYGNWLLDDASEQAGAEPDDCYVSGTEPLAKRCPDLVIEVVWTRGGLDKLEIYRRLGIGEVWFWKRDAISVHVLADGRYEPRTPARDRSGSGVSPGRGRSTERGDPPAARSPPLGWLIRNVRHRRASLVSHRENRADRDICDGLSAVMTADSVGNACGEAEVTPWDGAKTRARPAGHGRCFGPTGPTTPRIPERFSEGSACSWAHSHVVSLFDHCNGHRGWHQDRGGAGADAARTDGAGGDRRTGSAA